jgi:hypothetical protein
MPASCYVTPTPVSFKWAPGNIFNTPNHGLKLTDSAADCCLLCQAFKNCTFWTYEFAGTVAKPTCYNQAGACCYLKTDAAWGGRQASQTGSVSGSDKPLPAPPSTVFALFPETLGRAVDFTAPSPAEFSAVPSGSFGGDGGSNLGGNTYVWFRSSTLVRAFAQHCTTLEMIWNARDT